MYYVLFYGQYEPCGMSVNKTASDPAPVELLFEAGSVTIQKADDWLEMVTSSGLALTLSCPVLLATTEMKT